MKKKQPVKEFKNIISNPQEVISLIEEGLSDGTSFTITFNSEVARDHYFVRIHDSVTGRTENLRAKSLYGAFIGVMYDQCIKITDPRTLYRPTWCETRDEHKKEIFQAELNAKGFIPEVNHNLQAGGELTVCKSQHPNDYSVFTTTIINNNYATHPFSVTRESLKSSLAITETSAKIINGAMENIDDVIDFATVPETQNLALTGETSQ